MENQLKVENIKELFVIYHHGAGSAWAAEEYAKGNSYVRTNRTGGY